MGFPLISTLLAVWRKGEIMTLTWQLQLYNAISKAWIIDSRGIAKKVKNVGLPAPFQIHDCEANRQCPNCQHIIDNSDVCLDWPGLPTGVKFDPSDVELIEHLAAKCGVGGSKPHMLIDEFIPTIDGDDGICYTHPENLPGAKKDGTSVHFFYRITSAYSNGPRKRRRIQDQENAIKSHVRWHKTGKTKPVIENGIQKGFKKIMVLYGSSKRGSKPDKCNWVMHQYHIGADEDETEGEFVVSKIFYQPQKENDKRDLSLPVEESDVVTMVQAIPKTPMTNTPDPPRPRNTPLSDYISSDYYVPSSIQKNECPSDQLPSNHHSFDLFQMENTDYATCLTGNSKAVDLSSADSLLCDEITDSYLTLDDLKPDNPSSTQAGAGDDTTGLHQRCDISDLDNLELDTPPDFNLNNLQFPFQDSVFDWLDRL